MKSLLCVVDMQNDFISGALGSVQAQKIIPALADYISHWDGDLAYTLDTHDAHYPDTQEGHLLPVPHCQKGTVGWQLHPEIAKAIEATGKQAVCFEKPAFGSVAFGAFLQEKQYEQIVFAGVCTDICVISNAMLAKAFLPETKVIVDAALCAGVTEESHKTALRAMQACQIFIEHQA